MSGAGNKPGVEVLWELGEVLACTSFGESLASILSSPEGGPAKEAAFMCSNFCF